MHYVLLCDSLFLAWLIYWLCLTIIRFHLGLILTVSHSSSHLRYLGFVHRKSSQRRTNIILPYLRNSNTPYLYFQLYFQLHDSYSSCLKIWTRWWRLEVLFYPKWLILRHTHDQWDAPWVSSTHQFLYEPNLLRDYASSLDRNRALVVIALQSLWVRLPLLQFVSIAKIASLVLNRHQIPLIDHWLIDRKI